MFHKAIVRLSALYLGIIMLISLAFSVSLYQVSIRELDRGLRRQNEIIINGPRFSAIFEDPRELVAGRQQSLDRARSNIIVNLLLVNLAILISGGFLSYYLARRTLAPIEEAHQAQSRFTADASHELRTPIAAMQTETEVTLMDPKLNLAKAKKQLTSNLEELSKLTALTEGLLRLARLENNRVDKQPIDINEIIKAAKHRIADKAGTKSIEIRYQAKKPLSVLGEKSSLTEALTTVLDNAIKYSPDNTRVTISTEKEPRYVVIKIKDQGIGIAKQDIPLIFNRFYRADTSRAKIKADGYGIGLAIAKNIIDLHEGSISLSSKIGKSSTFIIKLPLAA